MPDIVLVAAVPQNVRDFSNQLSCVFVEIITFLCRSHLEVI